MLTIQVLTPVSDSSTDVSGTTVELPAAVFDTEINIPLIHQVVVGQLAAARQGTHDTKTRGEVRGGGRKPYKQKGTGRARQGSTRAPQFVGGGVVHGPTPRDYSQRTPKKMKAAALRSALSDRARNDRIHVVNALISGETPSTKVASASLAVVSARRHLLVVLDRADQVTWRSIRNIPEVHVLAPDQLNTYDVLVSDDVVFTEAALGSFLARPGLMGSRARQTDTDVSAGAAESTSPDQLSTEPPVDGSEPAGFPIKGNRDSMKYHLPGSRWFDQTIAEVWFATEAAAIDAGFAKAGARKASADAAPTEGSDQ
jgi:large subunit ribosomal protein L4